MPVEWAILLAVVVSDAVLLAETSFRLEASSQLRILAGLTVLVLVFVYCRRKRLTRVAHFTSSNFALVLSTNASAILMFILTGLLPLPRWDGALAAADHALGLDWLTMDRWLAHYPAVETTAQAVYLSLGPETLILLIALELLGHHNQARTFILGFIVSAIAAIGIAVLIPAAGPAVYYDLPIPATTRYVSQMAGLRDGTLRTIDLFDGAEGLVVFPSFHAALAVLCIYAARPLRVLKYPLLVLNLLIILASPAVGHHYFIDIFAGIVLAALTISLSRFLLPETGKQEVAGVGKTRRLIPRG
jgi:membrane-associated phospholipid phosphatase